MQFDPNKKPQFHEFFKWLYFLATWIFARSKR